MGNTLILGVKIRFLDVIGCPLELAQGVFEPAVALGSFYAFVFTGAFVIARVQPGPGNQMAESGKLFYVRSGFSKYSNCGTLLYGTL